MDWTKPPPAVGVLLRRVGPHRAPGLPGRERERRLVDEGHAGGVQQGSDHDLAVRLHLAAVGRDAVAFNRFAVLDRGGARVPAQCDVGSEPRVAVDLLADPAGDPPQPQAVVLRHRRELDGAAVDEPQHPARELVDRAHLEARQAFARPLPDLLGGLVREGDEGDRLGRRAEASGGVAGPRHHRPGLAGPGAGGDHRPVFEARGGPSLVGVEGRQQRVGGGGGLRAPVPPGPRTVVLSASEAGDLHRAPGHAALPAGAHHDPARPPDVGGRHPWQRGPRGTPGGAGRSGTTRRCRCCWLPTPPAKASTCTFVCPGHPLLDAVIDLILERHRDLLKRGAVLVDERDHGTTPRVLFSIEHALQDAGVTRAGERRVVSKRVLYVELDNDGVTRHLHYAPYLDYRPLADDEPAVDAFLERPECAWVGRDLEPAAQAYAVADVVPEHLAEVRAARLALIDKTEAAVKDRLTKEISYWDHRAAQLALEEEPARPARASTRARRAGGRTPCSAGCRSGSRN